MEKSRETSTKNRRGYRGYGKFQEESDNDVCSDNDDCQVVKSIINAYTVSPKKGNPNLSSFNVMNIR